MFIACSPQAPTQFPAGRAIAPLAVALALWLSPSAYAETSETLLTVISADGTTTTLDREALDALPQRAFNTRTQWTWDEQSFSGPLLVDVLTAAGFPDPAGGGVIEFVADDGYHARIDLAASAQYLTRDYPIVTTRIDGAPFELENNGPLWVMFPYDARPDLDIKPVHDMTVWQLLQIVELTE